MDLVVEDFQEKTSPEILKEVNLLMKEYRANYKVWPRIVHISREYIARFIAPIEIGGVHGLTLKEYVERYNIAVANGVQAEIVFN